MNRGQLETQWMQSLIDWIDARLDFWNRNLSGREGWMVFASFFMVTYMSLFSYSGLIHILPIGGVLWLLLTVLFTTVAVMLFWGVATVVPVGDSKASGSEAALSGEKLEIMRREALIPRDLAFSNVAIVALGVLTVTLLLTGIFISHTKLFYAYFCVLMGLFALHIARRGDLALLARGMAKGLLLGGSFIFLASLLLEPMSDATYYGLFTNPNNLEPLASLVLASSLHVLVNGNKPWKAMSILGIALATICGVASRSRTFQLVLLILVITWVIYTVRNFKGKKRYALWLAPLITVVLSLPIFIYAVRPVFYEFSKSATFVVAPYQEAKAKLVRQTEERVKKENQTKQAVSFKPIGLPSWVSGNEVASKIFTRVGNTVAAFDDVLESEIEMPALEKDMADEKRAALVDNFFDQIPPTKQNTDLSRAMNKKSLFFALDGITTHRLNIWTTFLENTHYLGQPVPSLIVFGYGVSGYPHNLLIQIGVDSGIFGGLAFLLLFVRAALYVARFLFRKQKEGRKGQTLFLFFPFAMLVVMVSGMLSNGNVPFSNFIFYAYVSSWPVYLKMEEWRRL